MPLSFVSKQTTTLVLVQDAEHQTVSFLFPSLGYTTHCLTVSIKPVSLLLYWGLESTAVNLSPVFRRPEFSSDSLNKSHTDLPVCTKEGKEYKHTEAMEKKTHRESQCNDVT